MLKERFFTESNIDDATDGLIRDFQKNRTRKLLQSPVKETTKSKIALLVLDMQNYFIDSSSHAYVPSAEAIVPNIRGLMDRFLAAGHPVIMTRHVNTPENAAMMGRWWRDLMTPGPMNRLTPKLSTDGCHILEKSQYDAFYNTGLKGLLNGVEQVVVTGLMTHLCAETTARSAFVQGFEVFFTADGTATYNLALHRASLLNLSHGFAHIIRCKDAEALL